MNGYLINGSCQHEVPNDMPRFLDLIRSFTMAEVDYLVNFHLCLPPGKKPAFFLGTQAQRWAQTNIHIVSSGQQQIYSLLSPINHSHLSKRGALGTKVKVVCQFQNPWFSENVQLSLNRWYFSLFYIQELNDIFKPTCRGGQQWVYICEYTKHSLFLYSYLLIIVLFSI